MDQEIYDTYPDEITVREFKHKGIVYVTTFLNHKEYHKADLAKLYESRWQVEINLRSIKSILNMDFLSCKTPDMVEKEVGIHFLAYNIIRVIMAEACSAHGKVPNAISFKGTVQLLNQFMTKYSTTATEKNASLYQEMLALVVCNEIGKRPGRVEPRKVKRRRRPFTLLDRSRQTEIAKLKNRKIQREIKYAMA